jgi:hypothetical protein
MPAGRSSFGLRLGAMLPLVLAGFGLALILSWAWQPWSDWKTWSAWETLQDPGWRPLAGLGAWLAYAAFTWRGSRPRALARAEGVLAWDGQGWYWRAGPPAGAAIACASDDGVQVVPEVALDLQGLLLLRLQPLDPHARPQEWLWMTPQGDPGRWRAFRRALYSSGTRPAQ